ncbi:HD domain-containing protein [Singulisphaera rosea]
MGVDDQAILKVILSSHALELDSIHGVAHWARVLENGLRLATETGADVEVLRLFALLHDSRRMNDGSDPEHGPRAAEFARTLRGRAFEITSPQFNQLYEACAGHTGGRTHPDVTVRTCWDSDRLDLGRIGIRPRPKLLCTEVARRDETIQWAQARAEANLIPDFVRKAWGISLAIPH